MMTTTPTCPRPRFILTYAAGVTVLALIAGALQRILT